MPEHRKRRLLLAGLFLFYLYIAFQTPYQIDDWSWGTATGIRRLIYAELNGRYAGNLLECALVRAKWLRCLVMALTPVAITALLSNLAEGKRGGAFTLLLGNLLLLTLPLDIWSQTQGWIAGFSNFVFSGLLLCLYLLFLRDMDRLDGSPRRIWIAVGLFLFGVTQQLFLENLALVFLAGSAAAVILYLLRRRRVPPALAALTLGNAVGTAAMFSNAVMGQLMTTGKALGVERALVVPLDEGIAVFVKGVVLRFGQDFATRLWCRNTVLSSLIALLLLAWLLRRGRRGLRWVLGGLNLLCVGYFLIARFYGPVALPAWMPVHYLSGLMDPGFFLLVCFECVLLWRGEPERLAWLLLVWAAGPVIILPCTLVNTVGPRNYYAPALMLILFALLLAFPLWESLDRRRGRLTAGLVAAALCLICAHRAAVYWDIGLTTRESERRLRAAAETGAESVTLPIFPHRAYLWVPDLYSVPRPFFREFYGLEEEVELFFEAWETLNKSPRAS